jgi:ABC-type multidrug transport system fused ATPase/permease subunit
VAGSESNCSVSVTGVPYSPGEVLSVSAALFVGSYNFMSLVPNLTAIREGMKAAKRLYRVIDSTPTISLSQEGITRDKL